MTSIIATPLGHRWRHLPQVVQSQIIFRSRGDDAEFCLVDDLTHEKLPDIVPGTDGLALAALVAVFERVSACFFYLIYNFFKGWGKVSIIVSNPLFYALTF